jgi:thioredoxin reductase (NADPH)
MGVETETGNVVSVEPQPGGFLLKTEEKTYETRTIILAAGASHNHLNVPGEEELAGMGVSYCATCDGAFFRGKTTAVVGGGDVAVEDALFLARGCEKVYLVHRRDKLRAAKMLQDSLFAQPNIEVCINSTVEKILGGDMVEGVLLHNKETGQSSELPVQGVFIAVGIHPNTEPFAALVDTDENGYIIAGEDAVTSCPGIFAAGDIRTKALRQIITAVADGANAINSVEKYLLNL